MKVLVFIDHDIICRHFVSNGALAPLVRSANTRFVFPDDGRKRVKLEPATLPLGAPYELLPVDARRAVMWRWQLYADQLKFRPGRAERQIRRMRRRFLGWKAALLLTFAGLPPVEPFFLTWLQGRFAERPNRALEALLDRERPDVIIHPSVLEGVFINDLVEQASARGIPLVVAMNSWDNPSTKRAVVGHPDRLLVWGPQTAAHARRFMQMPPGRIVIFGAAQFDQFREPPRIDRSAFAAAHAADPASRLVLFAGSSAQTDEYAALAALDAVISEGRLPNTTVIYRPHPWGEGGRDGARIARASWRHVRIHAAMRNYVERLAHGPVGMTLPDYRDTHDVLSVADVVVSPMSTILLEAMLHGKPVVVFAPRGEDGSMILANRLPMTHFDDFLSVDAVRRAETRAELIEVLAGLADPAVGTAVGQASRTAAEHFVASFDAPWGERLVDFLSSLVQVRRDVREVG